MLPSRSIPSVLCLSLLAVTSASHVTACTAAQGRAAEGPLLSLGEAACEAFIPIAVPGYAPLDVLGCKGAEAAIAGILAGVTPAPSAPPVAAAPVSPGSAPLPMPGPAAMAAPAPVPSEPHRPLKIGGRTVGLVRAPLGVVLAAQIKLDARLGK